MYICVLVCMYYLLCVDLVLDHQEAAHELDDSVRMKVREALLKRHHHQNDKKRNNLLPMVKSLTDSGRRHSEPHSMDKTGELNCTFYMCIIKEYFWLNTTLTLSSVDRIKSFFFYLLLFIWIPISFHNVVASLPGAHKRTKTYIQLKYTNITYINITLPHVHIYLHIHTHTAFDNISTYRQSQIN